MIKLKQIFNELHYIKESRGISATLIQIFCMVKKRLSYHTNEIILFVYNLDNVSLTSKIDLEELTIKQAKTEDLCYFKSIENPDVVERYRFLLKKGRICLMALKDEQVVAYTWFTPETNPTIEHLYIPLTQYDVYLFAVNTPPAFRRQGYQFILQQRMLQILYEQGYKRVLTLVQADNAASVRLFKKLHYQIASHLTRVGILGLVLARYCPNIFEHGGVLVTWFSYPIWGYRRNHNAGKLLS